MPETGEYGGIPARRPPKRRSPSGKQRHAARARRRQAKASRKRNR